MSEKQAKLGRFGVAILAVLAVAAGLSGRAYTQYRAALKSAWMSRHALTIARAEMERAEKGVPEDWSHRHLVFSNPGSEESAIQNGRYDSWLNITNDPRFIMQQKKRAAGTKKLIDGQVFAAASGKFGFGSPIGTKGGKAGGKQTAPIHRDWSIGLGAGNPSQVSYPAKWSFDTTTASCTADFVVYPTGALGAAGQASIIGYFNLYTGCGGTVPTVAWAFNTGGTITGAPSFSVDGKQLAFIQTTGTAATLVLLKLPTALPGTGTLVAPTTLATTQTASTYPACTAPCMLRLTLNGSPADTLSNPWVDYGSDSLFVGDNTGKLHKFSPVFTGTAGTPAAETIVSWPVTLAAGSALGSPVFDSGTGKVFVGNAAGVFFSVGGGTPAFLPGVITGHVYGTSSDLGASTAEIVDAPLVDSAAGEAYVFLQEDASGHNAVVQFPTSFTSGAGIEKQVGNFTRNTEFELSGAFDNIYINSESACESSCTPTGNLYVAGNTAVNATLYQIPIAANVMGTVHTGPVIGDAGFFGRSSPVTEFLTDNPATANVTITGNPGPFGQNWPNLSRSVTIGTVKYEFSNAAPAASTATVVQVRFNGTSISGTTNERNTALNLAAAINADSSLCTGTLPCFGSGTVANAAVTAAQDGTNLNQIDLTATVGGTAGNFTLTNSGPTTTGIAVSTVTGGTSVDSIYLSTYSNDNNGNAATCTSGCVYSFDVTAGTTITGTTAPSATLPVTANIANADGYVTGGIIIDNDFSSLTLNTQQIYFLTLDNETAAVCTSSSHICATQASQSGLN
jgi:hypothetical protein